jgi:hypothetical protein
MWKLGLGPRNSFSGNIFFEFSVLCLCSVSQQNITPPLPSRVATHHTGSFVLVSYKKLGDKKSQTQCSWILRSGTHRRTHCFYTLQLVMTTFVLEHDFFLLPKFNTISIQFHYFLLSLGLYSNPDYC